MSFPVIWMSPATKRLEWWRWALGIPVALAALALAVLWALGSWNPWRYVILLKYFANPWLGAAAVAAGAYAAMGLLLPIRSEALQPVRITLRLSVVAIGLIGLMVGVTLNPLFRYETTEMGRSDDGDRVVALVISGGLRERELQVWNGAGLWAREVGSLGRPCSSVKVVFVDRDSVVVNQGYGDWVFELDPDTGESRHVFGQRCPIGPIPATDRG
jgi:hypothetical protein